MSRRDINSSDVGFFNALRTGISKEAVALEQETADFLGIPSVSPSILDQLEREAASAGSEGNKEEDSPTSPTASIPTEESAGQLAVDEQTNDTTDTEEVPGPDLPDRSTYGKLFSEKRGHPLQILDVLTMRYQGKWPQWEPETLLWALRRDFGSVSELARNKVQALVLATQNDMAWQDWDIFEDSGLAWNDIIPIFGAFQPMTPMQVAFTVQVLREIRSDEEFTNEVNAYIAAILEEHGWVYAPEEWFAGAQEIMDRKGWAVGFKTEVEDAWERVKDVDPTEIEWKEDSLGVHLLKMATVKMYIDSRNKLRETIPGPSRMASTVTPPVPVSM